MSDLNNTIVDGRLTADLRSGEKNDRAWASGTVANNTGYGKGLRVNYFQFLVNGPYAKALADSPHFKKGMKIAVSGIGRTGMNEIVIADGHTIKVPTFRIDATTVKAYGELPKSERTSSDAGSEVPEGAFDAPEASSSEDEAADSPV